MSVLRRVAALFLLFPGVHGGESSSSSSNATTCHDDGTLLLTTTTTATTACRHDPTWRTVDYTTCQELTAWHPRGQWWSEEKVKAEVGHAEYEALQTCFDDAWQQVWKTNNSLQKACTNDNDTPCTTRDIHQTEHYVGSHPDEGQIMILEHALSPNEVLAIKTLGTCVYQILPHEWPHYQQRTNIGTNVEYTEKGAHYCTYLQGLLQTFVPGVAASLYAAVRTAYDLGQWQDQEYLGQRFPSPDELGIRTAEYLTYQTQHRVGLHADSKSVFSMSVALTNDYEGGSFYLASSSKLFRAPSIGSAIVFFSESKHAVSPVTSGLRQVLVIEFWTEEDAPVGFPRPNPEEFQGWKEGIREEVRFTY